MISDAALDGKSYEEYLAEAIRDIPLYCKEWTNFNPADPGMTILENLTAFQMLQQNYIHQIPGSMEEAVMGLMGFHAKEGRCAKALVAAMSQTQDIELPANQRFYVGDVAYETNHELKLKKNRLLEVYSYIEEGHKEYDLSGVVQGGGGNTRYLFGRNPKPDDALYLLLEDVPDEGRDFIMYFTLENDERRNPSDENWKDSFARLEWQCYTALGYQKLGCKDMTYGFTHSGEVRLKFKNAEPAITKLHGQQGYVIRCVIREADYDIAPRLTGIYAFLFEAWQKESQALVYTFPRKDMISVSSHIFEEEYISVFCKEEGEDFYRHYVEKPEDGTKGRYYEKEKTGYGSFQFGFDIERFGYGPGINPDAVKIVAYNEAMMRQYDLGLVYGYDNQEIQLPVGNIVGGSFSLIVKRQTDEGEEQFEFVKPGRTKDGELQYTLDENRGVIRIVDAGNYIEARLFLGAVSTTLGHEGNVLAGNELIAAGDGFGATFITPIGGVGGCFKEKITGIRKRFLEDLDKPYVAVTEADYERLVYEIPGLCIDKVKAVADTMMNRVEVTVKPATDENRPKLSEHYEKIIGQYLEERRLLNTVVSLHQPVYAAVNVQATIYVKKHYEHCKEIIEEALNRQLDYIHGRQNFGECLKYDDVYGMLEKLPCVSYIHDLSIYPVNPNYVMVKEADLQPLGYVLLYPGDFYLEVITDIERRPS